MIHPSRFDLHKQITSSMEAIHQAAWDGDVAAIDRLVAEDGGRLNAQIQGEMTVVRLNVSGCTPLMLAAHQGHDAAVARLLALGADVGLQSANGVPVIHWSCAHDKSATLALLLDAGASMDTRGNFGRTPLMVAAELGANACMTLLLARFKDALAEHLVMADEDGNSALHLACMKNQPSTLALLQDAGASMDASNNLGRTPLIVAAGCGNTVGEHLAMVDNEGDTAVHYACIFNQPTLLALLLDACASTNAINQFGRTPLMAAAVDGASDCVILLLSRDDWIACVGSRRKT